MKKRILPVALTISMFMVSAFPAYAAEYTQILNNNEIKTVQSPVEAVSFESEDNLGVTPRTRGYVDATIAAGQIKIYGPTVYLLNNFGGFVLGVQASSGPSYYGLYNRDTGTFYPIKYNTSGSTFRGTLFAPVNGNYSLAIQNLSSRSIKYTGFYDY